MTKSEREERRRALIALERMHLSSRDVVITDGEARRRGLRPLRPPPAQIAERHVPASRLALVQDRKAGVVHDPRPVRVRDKVAPSASFYEDHDTL